MSDTTSTEQPQQLTNNTADPLFVGRENDFDDLHCGVCFTPVLDAVRCGNRHLFCWKCIETWNATRSAGGRQPSTAQWQPAAYRPQYLAVVLDPSALVSRPSAAGSATATSTGRDPAPPDEEPSTTAADGDAGQSRCIVVDALSLIRIDGKTNNEHIAELVAALDKGVTEAAKKLELGWNKARHVVRTADVLKRRVDKEAVGYIVTADAAKAFFGRLQLFGKLANQVYAESTKIRIIVDAAAQSVNALGPQMKILVERIRYATEMIPYSGPEIRRAGPATAERLTSTLQSARNSLEAIEKPKNEIAKATKSNGVQFERLKKIHGKSSGKTETAAAESTRVLHRVGLIKANADTMLENFRTAFDALQTASTEVSLLSSTTSSDLQLLPEVIFRALVSTSCPVCRTTGVFVPDQNVGRLAAELSVACASTADDDGEGGSDEPHSKVRKLTVHRAT